MLKSFTTYVSLVFFLGFLSFLTDSYSASFFPVGKLEAKKTYGVKEKCEQVEGQPCFSIIGKEVEYLEVHDGVLIENPEKKEKYLEKMEIIKEENRKNFILEKDISFGKGVATKIVRIIKEKDLSTDDTIEAIAVFQKTFLLLKNGFLKQAKATLLAIDDSLTANTIDAAERDFLVRSINYHLGI